MTWFKQPKKNPLMASLALGLCLLALGIGFQALGEGGWAQEVEIEVLVEGVWALQGRDQVQEEQGQALGVEIEVQGEGLWVLRDHTVQEERYPALKDCIVQEMIAQNHMVGGPLKIMHVRIHPGLQGGPLMVGLCLSPLLWYNCLATLTDEYTTGLLTATTMTIKAIGNCFLKGSNHFFEINIRTLVKFVLHQKFSERLCCSLIIFVWLGTSDSDCH
jgi:hypothetical protein